MVSFQLKFWYFLDLLTNHINNKLWWLQVRKTLDRSYFRAVQRYFLAFAATVVTFSDTLVTESEWFLTFRWNVCNITRVGHLRRIISFSSETIYWNRNRHCHCHNNLSPFLFGHCGSHKWSRTVFIISFLYFLWWQDQQVDILRKLRRILGKTEGKKYVWIHDHLRLL